MSAGGVPVVQLLLNITPAEREASQPAQTTQQRAEAAANSQLPQPVTYGYHNSFHTHAVPSKADSSPPNYSIASSNTSLKRSRHVEVPSKPSADVLPRYTCSIMQSGVLGMKPELSTPFQIASDRKWRDVFVELRGTSLLIYRVKAASLFSSKRRALCAGRLLRTYTLQHAEVGLASDIKKVGPIPKSPFAKLIPVAARLKLYETDPHLFEPMREFVFRLRLEGEQFLLCSSSQEDMLDWVEQLCSAIDISPPIEDRSEPRNKTLPRRARRQRLLDGRLGSLDNLANMSVGRRILAEQERIIRELYPHLAGESTETAPSGEEHQQQEQHESSGQQHHGQEHSRGSDPEAEDLDPDDILSPSDNHRRRPASRRTEETTSNSQSETPNSDSQPSGDLQRYPSRGSQNTQAEIPAHVEYNPKTAIPTEQNYMHVMRYRRRCAPILLANSPRASDIVFVNGKRLRIDVKNYQLVPWEMYPPKYNAHGFPKDVLAKVQAASSEDEGASSSSGATSARPAMARGESEHTLHSVQSTATEQDHDLDDLHHDLTPTSTSSLSETYSHPASNHGIERIDSGPTDVPPSPTQSAKMSGAMSGMLHALAGLVPKTRNSLSSDEHSETGSGLVVMGGLGVF